MQKTEPQLTTIFKNGALGSALIAVISLLMGCFFSNPFHKWFAVFAGVVSVISFALWRSLRKRSIPEYCFIPRHILLIVVGILIIILIGSGLLLYIRG